MYFDVFSILFSCITNLIFYMIGVMVYLLTVRFYLVSTLWTLTGVAITLAFNCHCFSIWICVDGAWTSLPITLVMKAYMTKSLSWLEHILPSSSSWCSRLGCSWSFHHWCGHHFPVCPAYHCSPVDSQIGLGSAWCGLTQPALDDFTV